jgi:mono/diheme cytochrome c family protein
MTLAWPSSVRGRVLLAIAVLVGLLILISAVSWIRLQSTQPTISDPPPGMLSILTRPIPDGPDAGLIGRGRYLATAGDCASCHTRRGGRPFEGGLGLETPFGIIYSANITGDRDTGIGNWSSDQFYRALHEGVAPAGKRLYPALPYPHFTLVHRADTDAILAFLKTVPAVRYTPPANRLPFPVNLRPSLIAWNAINFSPGEFRSDPAKSAQWNRGAYLVEGLGHCAACHSPKSALGADLRSQAYRGAVINNTVAPDLTSNMRRGLGRWSAGEIVEYLKTGRNRHANASGPMAEVVTYSTSLLSNSDLLAMATYLKSIPPSTGARRSSSASAALRDEGLPESPEPSGPAPNAAAMRAGGAIFFDVCTACHLNGGKGQSKTFPPLAGSAVAQQNDPTGIIRMILAGARTAPTPSRPGFQSMPSFAWKLDDQQVADVATYVRNSWGNQAPEVDRRQVAKLRAKLKLSKPQSRDRK